MINPIIYLTQTNNQYTLIETDTTEALINKPTYVFDKLGVFKAQSTIDVNSLKSLLEIDIISVLNTSNTYEIAMVLNNQYYKISVTKDVKGLELLGRIHGTINKHIIAMFRRKGTLENVEYVQYLYAIRKGRITEEQVKQLI